MWSCRTVCREKITSSCFVLFRFKFNLHKVMYKQLSSWLLHGILMDPYAEFYVHKVKKLKTLASVPHNQDDELGIGGLSGQQIQQIQVCGLF